MYMHKNIYIDKKDFGYSVAISDVYALIGNPSFESFNSSSTNPILEEGSVDVYKYNSNTSSTFIYDRTIKLSSLKEDYYALYTENYTTSSIASLSGSHSLSTEMNTTGSNSGSIDIFNNYEFLLANSEDMFTLSSDFGRSLDIYENLCAIGCTRMTYTFLNMDEVIRNEDGCIEIHDLSKEKSKTQTIFAPISSSFLNFPSIDTGSNSFGWSVSINKDFLVVGSPYTNNSGSVFIFMSGSNGYNYHSYITSSGQNLFGSCLKLDKNFNKLIVGNGSIIDNNSKAYLYEYVFATGKWTLIQEFTSNKAVENLKILPVPQHDPVITLPDGYGNSVSIYCSSSTDVAVAVGAPYDRIYKEFSGSNCYRDGCVYVYNSKNCILPSGDCGVSSGFNIGTGPTYAGQVTDGGTRIESISEQPDNSVIASGTINSFNGTSIFKKHIFRMNSIGKFDSSFNPPTSTHELNVVQHLLEPDGKILVWGANWIIGQTTHSILRLNNNGTIDNTFTASISASNPITVLSDGQAISVNGFYNAVGSVIRRADGKYMITGWFSHVSGSVRKRIARLNNNGSLDTTFEAATLDFFDAPVHLTASYHGEVTIHSGILNAGYRFYHESENTVVNQPPSYFYVIPGKTYYINVSGSVGVSPLHPFALRLSPNNTENVPGTFNNDPLSGRHSGSTNTVITYSVPENTQHWSPSAVFVDVTQPSSVYGSLIPIPPAYPLINCMGLQSDNKVLIGGSFSIGRNSVGLTHHHYIARLNENGTLDSNFKVGFNSIPTKIIQLSDKKILVGGFFSYASNTNDPLRAPVYTLGVRQQMRITKLKETGEFDAEFSGGINNNWPQHTPPISGVTVDSMAVQPDGKIFIGGTFSKYNNEDRNGILRLNRDGTLDASFNPGTGLSATGSEKTLFEINFNCRVVTILNNTQILVGGRFLSYNNTGSNFIVRINNDGTREKSLTEQEIDALPKTCSVNDLGWKETKLFGDVDSFKFNRFGHSVDISEDKLLISCPKFLSEFSSSYVQNTLFKSVDCDDLTENDYLGMFYIYDKQEENWNNIYAKFKPRKRFGYPFNFFAHDVSIHKKNLIVGSPIALTDSNRIIEIVEDKENVAENLHGNFSIFNLNEFESHHHVGNVFYRNGKMVFSNSASVFDNMFNNDVNDEPVYDISYNSKTSLYEKQIICTVSPGEFNYSTNPTAHVPSLIQLDLNKNGKFDFQDCDKILRGIYKKFNGNEQWWNLLQLEYPIGFENVVEKSKFEYHLTQSIKNETLYNLTDSILTTEEYNYIVNNLDNTLDINQDGLTDDRDLTILWKYFADTLTPDNYEMFTTSKSTSSRGVYSVAKDYLDTITGKSHRHLIKDVFHRRYVTSSNFTTQSFLSPYITTIGLYNNLDLIGVVKLGTPIKNEGKFPLNFIIRFDI